MQKKLMIIIALFTSIMFISACAVTPSKSQNPPPDVEFTATGTAKTKAKSYELAKKEANSFCERWNAVPSIINKKVAYDDDLLNIVKKGIKLATQTDDISLKDIPDIASGSTVETSLTYKCYQ